MEKTTYKPLAILVGLLISGFVFLSPNPTTLSQPAWHAIAIILLMITWWTTEAIPLAITSLLPFLLMPLFRILPTATLAKSYGHQIIFLFLGGFIIALALEKTGLHKRIALSILKLTGTKPQQIILGFMLSSALLSMWISNTATTLMMLPIAISIIEVATTNDGEQSKVFSTALLLSIAYSATIGGISTLIGTPPNAFLAAYLLDAHQHSLSFAKWIATILPLVIIALPIVFFMMTRVIFKFDWKKSIIDASVLEKQMQTLPSRSKAETRVAAIFSLTALLWIIRHLLTPYFPGLNDTSIALFGAILLFIIPGDDHHPILTIAILKKVPWGILLLFGGGLSIAAAIQHNNINTWLVHHLQFLQSMPSLLLIMSLTLIILLVTEVMSNTPTIATFLPIISAMAAAAHIDPIRLLIPTTLAASCAFMLPIATPPNAIIYSSQYISIKDMMKVGVVLNIIFWILISFYGWLI